MKLQQIVDMYGDNFEKVLNDKLKELVTQNPKFVYNPVGSGSKCYYDRGVPGGPECNGCIFGQALKELGWRDHTEMETDEIIVALFAIYTNFKAPFYWNRIQNKQDWGSSWEEAIQYRI